MDKRACLVSLGCLAAGLLAGRAVFTAPETSAPRTYANTLTPVKSPKPLLADYPAFVDPVQDSARFEAPVLVDDPGADLEVRAWRYSYNARGIIEIPNRLKGSATAVVVVHPWGIDDGQGWRSPDPAGVAFNCTPEKNRLYQKHVEQVLNPFLKAVRPHVKLVCYSLPNGPDPVRTRLYRSIHRRPTDAERRQGAAQLTAALGAFNYRAQGLPESLSLERERIVASYFRQFPGLDAGDRYNGAGFWQLPIPVVRQIDVAPDDVVAYDAEGYAPFRDFLRREGVRNVLLCGYATDMCVKSTTCGYMNLHPDFNTFLVGDATQATFPANGHSRHATNAALSYAALEHLVTQVSWVRPRGAAGVQGRR